MKETATPKIPYVEGTDNADAPLITKAMAEAIRGILLDIDPAWVRAVEGDSGKLLVVQGTGDPAFKAVTGDITMSNLGVTAIGNEKVKTAMLAALAVTEAILGGESVATGKIKELAVTAAKLAAECVETSKLKALAVTTAKLAESAVTEAKIADGAVTSRKVKLTRSQLALSEVTTIKESNAETWVALPGLAVTLELPYASRVVFEAFYSVEMFMSNLRKNQTVITLDANGVKLQQPVYGAGSTVAEIPINYVRNSIAYRWEYNMAANVSTAFKAYGLVAAGTAGAEIGSRFLGGSELIYEVYAQ